MYTEPTQVMKTEMSIASYWDLTKSFPAFNLYLVEGTWDGTPPTPEDGFYYSFANEADYQAVGFNPATMNVLNLYVRQSSSRDIYSGNRANKRLLFPRRYSLSTAAGWGSSDFVSWW